MKKSKQNSINQIVDLNPLYFLKQLKVLDLSHNKIQELYSLKELTGLKILRIHENLVESLEPLRDMKELVELWISKNRIELIELFNLLTLNNLRHIFIEGNPFENQSKHLEFLLAISPMLSSINGRGIHSFFPQQLSLKWNPTSFFRTVDGRVMLNQARSKLTDAQREFLLQYLNKYNDSNPINDSDNSFTTNGVITQRSKGTISDSNSNSGNNNNNNNQIIETQSIYGTQSDGGRPIKYFKAKKQIFQKKYISNTSSSTTTANTNTPTITSNDDISSITESEQNIDHHQHHQSNSQVATIIRFGESSSSPVALYLEEDGIGYTR